MCEGCLSTCKVQIYVPKPDEMPGSSNVKARCMCCCLCSICDSAAVHMCMLTGPVYCDSSGSSSVFSREMWLMSRYVPSLLHSKLQQSESTSWQCQPCMVRLLYSCAKPAHGRIGFSQTIMLTSWLHCMHTHTKSALLLLNKNRRDAWCSRCRSAAACKTGCTMCMQHAKCRSIKKANV